VGSYPITQGTLAASNNYTLSFTPGVLTVNAVQAVTQTPIITAAVLVSTNETHIQSTPLAPPVAEVAPVAPAQTVQPLPPVKYIDNPDTVFIIKAITFQEGMQLTARATATGTGFIYTLPENFTLEPKSSGSTSSTSTVGGVYTVTAVIADTNQPLPDWLQFDGVTETFVAGKVPADVDSIKIKIVAKRGDSLVGEAELTIQPKQ
jgi:hypothetical protein